MLFAAVFFILRLTLFLSLCIFPDFTRQIFFILLCIHTQKLTQFRT